MKRNHEKRHGGRVAEPVQVYLEGPDRRRLERLSDLLETTKSDVLRRGLDALERQMGNPADHPALRIIGIAKHASRPRPLPYDVGRKHDRFLAESEIASWKPRRQKRGR